MKRESLTIHIILIISLLLSACGGTKNSLQKAGTEPPLAPEKGQVWQLVALRGKEVSRTSDIITLSFNPEAGTISGKAPCNSYFGNYTLQLYHSTTSPLYHLAISDVGSTKVYCNEADMNAESRYLTLLPKADAIRIDAYTLTLFQKDKEILRFELQ